MTKKTRLSAQSKAFAALDELIVMYRALKADAVTVGDNNAADLFGRYAVDIEQHRSDIQTKGFTTGAILHTAKYVATH